MHLSTTEIQTPIHYQPVFEYSDLVEAIAELRKRVEKLESQGNESLKNEVNRLGDILYNQQKKMQRIECKVGI